MKRVFLSYANTDTWFANALAQALPDEVTIVDLHDKTVIGGSFAEVFRQQLQHSDVMVLLLSHDALESSWLAFELGAAMGLGKRILPVLLEGPNEIDTDKLDYLLRDQQFIKAHGLTAFEVAKKVRELIGK